jgi:hypothetical protein
MHVVRRCTSAYGARTGLLCVHTCTVHRNTDRKLLLMWKLMRMLVVALVRCPEVHVCEVHRPCHHVGARTRHVMHATFRRRCPGSVAAVCKIVCSPEAVNTSDILYTEACGKRSRRKWTFLVLGLTLNLGTGGEWLWCVSLRGRLSRGGTALGGLAQEWLLGVFRNMVVPFGSCRWLWSEAGRLHARAVKGRRHSRLRRSEWS